MSVAGRLATMAAGLVVAFLVAFGVGRVTGGTDADGGAGTRTGGVETEVHDMGDMADTAEPEDAGEDDDGPGHDVTGGEG